MQPHNNTFSLIRVLVPKISKHLQSANEQEQTRLLTGILEHCDPTFLTALDLAYGLVPSIALAEEPAEKQSPMLELHKSSPATIEQQMANAQAFLDALEEE